MNGTVKDLILKKATFDDLDAIAAVEALCFPAAEAATKKEFAQRLCYYADYFWLLFDGDKLVAFIDGMATNRKDLADEMYENAALHDVDGDWQMVFGVNTLPDYRGRGLAAYLIKAMIQSARAEGRKGLVLTCKESLLVYYSKFGFVDEGLSISNHGGVPWHQMRLTF